MTLREPWSTRDNVVELRPTLCSATGEMVDGVGVVAVRGALTMEAVGVCRRTIDGILRRRPGLVVLDLHLVTDASAAVPVLGLIRRYLARHGAVLVLAAMPRIVETALRTGHVLDLYTTAPSMHSALVLASSPTPSARRGAVR